MLDRLRWKMQSFLQGRNGMDQLARGSFYVALVLMVISMFTKRNIIYYVALIFWVYSLFRCLSKNISARYEENKKFLSFFSFEKSKFDHRKEYKMFACKQCGKHLRVPKGKGKIEVTCPSCGYKKIIRS